MKWGENMKELKTKILDMMNDFYIEDSEDMDGEELYKSGIYYGLNKAFFEIKEYEKKTIGK